MGVHEVEDKDSQDKHEPRLDKGNEEEYERLLVVANGDGVVADKDNKDG